KEHGAHVRDPVAVVQPKNRRGYDQPISATSRRRWRERRNVTHNRAVRRQEHAARKATLLDYQAVATDPGEKRRVPQLTRTATLPHGGPHELTAGIKGTNEWIPPVECHRGTVIQPHDTGDSLELGARPGIGVDRE